ncbi:PorP/SprF family type IX secretion system membrane protein [Croceivirga lutea]|uniref:PorP/SprF family type IX secretion system membrane protein n=1 Tax=Croceivirga lutea TaxID=1775167 RepID=UPI0016398DFC|nr:type IX secretion system membrane protein PorP/SprF [Croceivirga lutea]
MKFRNIYTILIILLTAFVASAQQDTHYTLYRYNMNLVNPAYAGSNGETVLGINFRSQWSSIEGAPETQSFFFSTNTGNNVGLGVSVINDRTFIEQQTLVMADFSYKLKLSATNTLYLGMKAGGNSYNANTAGLLTFGDSQDPSLTNLRGGFKFNLGLGALLQGEQYFVAISAPKILASERLNDDEGELSLDENRLHTYLTAGYDVAISTDWMFKPSVMVRYINATPLSLDVTATMEYKEVDFGLSYRLNEGIGGMFIWNASEWINIGYAYITEFENAIARNGNGSHEVFMNFSL